MICEYGAAFRALIPRAGTAQGGEGPDEITLSERPRLVNGSPEAKNRREGDLPQNFIAFFRLSR